MSRMGQRETPPNSPYMEEQIEEIDDNDLESLHDDQDVEILDAYEVEEIEEGGEEMADDGEIVEAMEREDATCIFEKHTKSVFCGSLSKDGKYAVTGGEDDKAYVWDVSTGQVILECTDHTDSVTFADFSHDDTYLATGDMSGIIRVRKMSDQSLVWDYNMGDLTWMHWHPMANVLLAGSVEGEIYVWKIPDGECKIVQGFGKRTEVATLLPDGKRLASGYEDGVIRIIDLKTCSVTATIPSNLGHTAAVTCLDCHPDNNLIMSASTDGTTVVTAANTGKVVCVLQNLKGESMEDDSETANSEKSKGNWVEAVAFHKDASQHIAATGTINGDIFIWDVDKKALRHTIDQGSGIAKLVWKENSSLLFSAGLDGILRCYDARSGECLQTFLGHVRDILDLSLSKDGTTILTTSDDTTARIFKNNIQ